MKRSIAIGMLVTMCAGCATADKFSHSLEGAVKTAQGSSTAVEVAQRDIVRLQVLGVVNIAAAAGPFAKPLAEADLMEGVACTPLAGPDNVHAALGAFSDSTDLVAKVAKKPDDTSFAGLLAQIKADQLAIKNASKVQSKTAAEDEASADMRCRVALRTDLASKDIASIQIGNAHAADPFTIVTTVVGVATSIATQIEALKRDEAVKKTVEAVIPVLESARDALAQPITAKFGPIVTLSPPDTKVDAEKSIIDNLKAMNSTALGATVTLDRWYEARQIQVLWQDLRANTPVCPQMVCLADPRARTNLDALVEAIYAYRGLAAVNSDATLKTLTTAIDNAKNSASTSAAEVLDSLGTVAGALSDVSDAVEKAKTATK